ncbi:TIGR04084 family radical SAM/SPASM domain-containing protein [Methanolacinia petrolearia]|uniref:TIGR04084 family radical SAM/SPASM domain-containing protein n=1 Tax=Methanolacinia petrolearia TaxID=54120 RepID=UPI003BAC3B00
MYYHLIVNDECNLNCSYCRGKEFFSCESDLESCDECVLLPSSPEYSPENLYSFLKKGDEPGILFYGGEPTLRPDLIMGFMDKMPSCRFSIYTNGLLIRNLPPGYIRRLDTILLSIDGDRRTTEGYRGKEVYDGLMESIKYINDSSFSGEIVARMTVAEKTDIYESVTFLADNKDYTFSSIHWQMDANFWYDYSERPGFREWIEESYNPGIARLAKKWLELIRETGIVPRWYPFCGLVYDILTGSGMAPAPMRCGAGHMNYAIQTDGNIVPCPCMVGMKGFYSGNIFDSDPKNLKKTEPGGDCLECDIAGFCGGRCLYSNVIRPWPEEGGRLVYGSILNLKSAVESVIPEIQEMIGQGLITAEDFRINKYNGCEIIP